MNKSAEILDLVADIYDCAIAPERWPTALQRMSEVIGLTSAGIVVKDPAKREYRMRYGWGGNDEFRKRYREKYFALNPAMTAGWFTGIDEPVTCSSVNGREEWLQCQMYKEWMAPQGWLDAAGLNLTKTATRHAMLSVIRSDTQCWFADDEFAALKQVNPHVRRATVIADLLEVREHGSSLLASTLDLLATSVLLVDLGGRLVHANRAALELLDGGQVLRRDGGLVSSHDPKLTKKLRAAVSSASQAPVASVPKSGIGVALRSTAGTEWAAWVLPLDAGLRGEAGATYSAAAAVFVRETGVSTPFPGELFVKRYGITPAECSVFIVLVQGKSPNEIAEILGLSLPTVKTHLAHLFAKTETRGQADLVRLALTSLGPAALPG